MRRYATWRPTCRGSLACGSPPPRRSPRAPSTARWRCGGFATIPSLWVSCWVSRCGARVTTGYWTSAVEHHPAKALHGCSVRHNPGSSGADLARRPAGRHGRPAGDRARPSGTDQHRRTRCRLMGATLPALHGRMTVEAALGRIAAPARARPSSPSAGSVGAERCRKPRPGGRAASRCASPRRRQRRPPVRHPRRRQQTRHQPRPVRRPGRARAGIELERGALAARSGSSSGLPASPLPIWAPAATSCSSAASPIPASPARPRRPSANIMATCASATMRRTRTCGSPILPR